MDQFGFVPTVASGQTVSAIKSQTWNKIADSANGGRVGQRATLLRAFPGWPPVLVRNTTGVAIPRPYRVFSIGEPEWVIADNKLPDCCFRLEPWSASRPVCIVQQPLTLNEIGLAVVVGPTLCDVTGGGTNTDRSGNPDGSGILVPGSGNAVTFAHQRPAGGGRVLALLGAGAAAPPLRMFRTPTGGIPAATSAVAGSAVCTEFPDGIGGNPGGTATVWNHRTNVIPQNVFVLAQMFRTTFGQERLFVIESNCPAGIVNPNPDPEPPVDDQGGGGDLPP